MSLKLAMANLTAATAGMAVLTGGAVRVAEPMIIASPEANAGAEAAIDPVTGQRYIKGGSVRASDLPVRERLPVSFLEEANAVQPVASNPSAALEALKPVRLASIDPATAAALCSGRSAEGCRKGGGGRWMTITGLAFVTLVGIAISGGGGRSISP